MRTLFSRAIQIDPSFHAALGVIVIFAIAEVFFATSYYVGRARANRVSAQAVSAATAHAPAASASSPAAAAPNPPPAAGICPPPPSLLLQFIRRGKKIRETRRPAK